MPEWVAQNSKPVGSLSIGSRQGPYLATLAQLVEHAPCKREVSGSIPLGGSIDGRPNDRVRTCKIAHDRLGAKMPVLLRVTYCLSLVHIAQQVEATDLKSVQCRFESDCGHGTVEHALCFRITNADNLKESLVMHTPQGDQHSAMGGALIGVMALKP